MFNTPLSNAIIITLLLFFTTLTVGWFGASQNPQVGDDLMKLFEKEVTNQMDSKDSFDIFTKLFANNLEACLLLFLGGASFGILTIFIMSLNGIVIGAIMETISKDHSALFVAAALIPHGIFEIPAFILSGALGILLAQVLIAEWYGSGNAAHAATAYGRLFLVVVLPLIFVAAAVEAFITPVVIHLVA